MIWQTSHRASARCRELADRHYNRQSIGAAHFAPPGRAVVLYAETTTGRAFWVSSWQRYVKHAWPGAWVCSAFRNEGVGLSSELIRSAVAVTRHHWPYVPNEGMITFVDAQAVRAKRDPGRCYRRAGFREVGTTQGGLLVLQLAPADMPAAEAPLNATLKMAL